MNTVSIMVLNQHPWLAERSFVELVLLDWSALSFRLLALVSIGAYKLHRDGNTAALDGELWVKSKLAIFS